MLEAQGAIVVSYTYNAWGEIISTTGTLASTIGVVNKLRYRSYYYDTETGFYYLQSRYYDPVVKRFISPDHTDYLTANGTFDGFNLYAYCLNNPVNNIDSSGNAPINVICAAIGALIGLPFGKYVANQLGYKKGLRYGLIRAGVVIGGAVIGWFAGTTITKIVVKFLYAYPSVKAKMPASLLWLLGIDKWSNVSFQNASALADHFAKHASEWGNKFKNANQYLNAARKLLRSSGKGIYEFTSNSGWFFKYNSKTNEFICVSDKGTISTFFKPIDGIAYWYEQVKKYK